MGFRAIERNELGDTWPMPGAADDAACADANNTGKGGKERRAVIPREPYPGDIGSHSPFLRIGDRTALDRYTHIQHTHARVHVNTRLWIAGRLAKIQISHRNTRDFKHNLRETTAAAKARQAGIDNRTLRQHSHRYEKNYAVRLWQR